MSIFDRLGERLDRWLTDDAERAGVVLNQRQSAGYGLAISQNVLDNPRWLDPNIETYRKAFASTVAVYACVGARASGVAGATLRVYDDSSGDREEVKDHPLRALMQRPNPEMSEAEFLVMTQTLMDATGFAAIQKVRAAADNVIQLWHLRSDWLKEIRHAQEPSDWEYRIPGRKEVVIIPARDVLIIPGGPSTDLGTTGMSPIAAALREVGIDSAMTDFLKLFIDTGASPRHALRTEREVPTQNEADEIKAKFQAAYGGYKQWTKVALLTGGMTVEKIGSNIDELAYPDLRFLTEAHICAVFGVPPIVANMQVGIDAATYSNYEQARKAFFESTVKYLWDRHDGAYTRGLLPEFEQNPNISIEFDTSLVPALQEDENGKWERMRAAATAGLITVNQFQSGVGLPGLDDAGDVLLLPISAMPTRPKDLLILADETAAPPEPVPTALQPGETPSDETPNPDDAESADSDAERSDPTVRRVVVLPVATRARISAVNRRRINKLTATFTPRLRALFKRQGEIVAKAFKKRADDIERETRAEWDPESPLLDAFLSRSIEGRALDDIPWADLEEEMARELRAIYETASLTAFSAAATSLDTDIAWDVSNPFVKGTLAQLGRRIVGINATTRADVARIVADGLTEGLKLSEISDNLRGLYRETYRNRSLTIARTESQTSYNLGTRDAYRASNLVQAMELHDNPEHDEDYGAADGLSCASRNGLVVGLDDVELHVMSEHPNGTLATSPILVTGLGEE